MKLIVLTVIYIAVFTANCRDLPDGSDFSDDIHNLSIDLDLPDDCDHGEDVSACRDLSNSHDVSYGPDLPDEPNNEASTNEPEPFPGGPVDFVFATDENVGIPTVEVGPGDVQGGVENSDSSAVNLKLKEDRRVQNERKLRGGSKCKSDIVCSLLGGSCVTNSTYCSGREVPSVCSGAKCKCCIPVSLEVKVHDLETKLQSMVVNLTVANSKLNTKIESKLDSMMTLIMSANSNLTIANSNLDLKIDSIMSDNSNLTIANSNLDLKIDSLISDNSNLTIANSNLDLKIDSINSNFTDANFDMKNELQFIKENLTNANTNLDSKLDSLKEGQGCPDGLFYFAPSNQCFRMLNDTRRSWDAADTACRALGLELAMPLDAVTLRSYLVTKYGYGINAHTWVGARGDGSYIRWQRTGQYISSSNPLWYPGYPGSSVSTSHCLLMETSESAWKSYPNTPYHSYSCSNSGGWGLCELRSD